MPIIRNTPGKVNGWVSAKDILGRITKSIEPELRPSAPIMIEKFDMAYHNLIQTEQTAGDEAQ